MRQRFIAGAVVVVVAGAIVALAVGSGGGSNGKSTGALRKLPIGAGAAEGRASASDGARMPGAVAAMPIRSPAEIVVRGTLPELDRSAIAYGFDGSVSGDAVSRLAAALGLKGDVTKDGDGFTVAGSSGLLQVAAGGAAPWSYQPGCASANGGGVECTASGSSTGVAIGCAAPTCGGDGKCPPLEPCDVKPPPRPAGLPSRDAATKAALDVLTRAGIAISGAETDVEDGWSQWTVVVNPVLDGHAVEGFIPAVGIGPGSAVTSASGFLGHPVALGQYPLAGTTAGLERLRAGQWLAVGGYAMLAAGSAGVAGGGAATKATAEAVPPTPMPAPMPPVATEPAPPKPDVPPGTSTVEPSPPDRPCDTCAPDDQPMPVPEPAPPVTITGVHLVLALVAGNDGALAIVPAYAFETDDGGTMPLVPAVVDELLEQPAPVPAPDPKSAPPPRPKAP